MALTDLQKTKLAAVWNVFRQGRTALTDANRESEWAAFITHVRNNVTPLNDEPTLRTAVLADSTSVTAAQRGLVTEARQHLGVAQPQQLAPGNGPNAPAPQPEVITKEGGIIGAILAVLGYLVFGPLGALLGGAAGLFGPAIVAAVRDSQAPARPVVPPVVAPQPVVAQGVRVVEAQQWLLGLDPARRNIPGLPAAVSTNLNGWHIMQTTEGTQPPQIRLGRLASGQFTPSYTLTPGADGALSFTEIPAGAGRAPIAFTGSVTPVPPFVAGTGGSNPPAAAVVGRLYELPVDHRLPVGITRAPNLRSLIVSVAVNGAPATNERLLGTFIGNLFRPSHIMRLSAEGAPEYMQIRYAPTAGYLVRGDGGVNLPANLAFNAVVVDTAQALPPGSSVPPPIINDPNLPAAPNQVGVDESAINNVYITRGVEAYTVVIAPDGNHYRYNGTVLDPTLPARRFQATSVQRVADTIGTPIAGELPVNLGATTAFSLNLVLFGDETLGYRVTENNERLTNRPLFGLAETHRVSLLPGHPNLNAPEIVMAPARNGNAAYQYINTQAIIDGQVRQVSITGSAAGDNFRVDGIYIADENGTWKPWRRIVGNEVGEGEAISLSITRNPGYPDTVQLVGANTNRFETIVQRGIRRYRADGAIGNSLSPANAQLPPTNLASIPDIAAPMPFLAFAGNQAFPRVAERREALTSFDLLKNSFTGGDGRWVSGWLHGNFQGQSGSVYLISADSGKTVSAIAVDAGDGTRREIPLGGAAFALDNDATPQALYERINTALGANNNWRLFQGRGRLDTTNIQDENINIRGGAGNSMFPPTNPARQVTGDTIDFAATGNAINANRNLIADALSGRAPYRGSLLTPGIASEYQTDWVAVQVTVGAETETRHVRLRGFLTSPGLSAANPFSNNGGSWPSTVNRFSVTGVDLIDEAGSVVPADTRGWNFLPELTIENNVINVTSQDSQTSLRQALGRVLRANPNSLLRMANAPTPVQQPNGVNVDRGELLGSPTTPNAVASIPAQPSLGTST